MKNIRKNILLLLTLSVLFACKNEKEMQNPLLSVFTTPHETAPFEDIKTEHYLPAFEEAMKLGKEDIASISNNTEQATFSNTIEALDQSGSTLGRISSIFFNLNSCETNDSMQAIAREVSPLLSDYSNDIMLNEKLFERVKTVFDNKEDLKLNQEQSTLLEDTYRGFIRSGANLKGQDREQYREISKKLSQLSLEFDENTLKETNDFTLHITDKSDLIGLPESTIEAAAATAKSKNLEGWAITLNYPSFGPFMKYSENRALREQLYRAYTSRACKGNEADNREIIKQIVNLRQQKAQLFGYKNYAEFALVDRMAETPERVNAFLNELLEASMPAAKKEYNELQAFAKTNGADFELMPWDWSVYSEKLRTEKYAINDEMVKPYFQLEKVRSGIFDLANRLYGISFEQRNDVQKYNSDITTWEVKDENNQYLGMLYLDFFPRDSKQGGAWMTTYVDQHTNENGDVRPHVSLVCNFTKPTDTKPSLLTFDEVTTFLHEFGHGLHGMLSRCQYKSVSGTSVARDFVELPSQILENWATEKEWLDLIATHYETGEKMPEELLNKIIVARNFQSGYASVRQLSFGMLDMAWHSLEQTFDQDVMAFETQAKKATELFKPVVGSSASSAFGHIFAGGYAAGYYGYKWAEVLDADAFAAFKEAGIFNKEVANSFRRNILEKGGSEKEMDLYVAFRGQEPGIDALLERSGLKK
ncbi:MAG: M3 family metallopeptidase [Bacteroidales bacterium]|nr:M3 family metallopeptidase [Bacteroidales bacterium]